MADGAGTSRNHKGAGTRRGSCCRSASPAAAYGKDENHHEQEAGCSKLERTVRNAPSSCIAESREEKDGCKEKPVGPSGISGEKRLATVAVRRNKSLCE